MIIGGHGKIALLLAPLLHSRGDHTTSVIRNPEHTADVTNSGAEAVVADVEKLSEQDIADLVRGQDAVVWSAGAGGGSPERTFAVDRDAAIRTMNAARDAGVSRFVMVSYMGAGKDHGVAEEDRFFPYAQAKAQADEHLRASGLDWTILGPGLLTRDEPTGKIVTSSGKTFPDYPTSRANVAHVIAAVLQDASTIGRTIEFGDGEIPIADAISARH